MLAVFRSVPPACVRESRIASREIRCGGTGKPGKWLANRIGVMRVAAPQFSQSLPMSSVDPTRESIAYEVRGESVSHFDAIQWQADDTRTHTLHLCQRCPVAEGMDCDG